MEDEVINNEISRILARDYSWLLGEVKKNIAKDQMSDYADDLLHFIILELYKKPIEYKEDLLDNKKIGWWILTSAGLQLRSSQSPFYMEFRRLKMSVREDVTLDIDREDTPYRDDLYECYQKGMETLEWYERKLIEEKYFNNLTFKGISQKYQITQLHIKNDIFKAMEKIRKYCCDI